MIAALVADTTDTPVWWLFIATLIVALFTLALAVITGTLARAAWKALGQLKAAVDDRHADVFSDLAHRWGSPEMTEALVRERNFSAEQLADVFASRPIPRSWNPIRERHRRQQDLDRVALLRVPSYFEDAVVITNAGGLSMDRLVEHIGGIASEEWDRWGPAVKVLQGADDLAFVEFEKLAQRVKKEDAARVAAKRSAP